MINEKETLTETVEIDVPNEHLNDVEEEQEQPSYEEQVKAFVDQFDEKAINSYREIQNQCFDYVETKFDEFKKTIIEMDVDTETSTDMFFIPQNDALLNNWLNNAQYVPLLDNYGKLDNEFKEKHDKIKSNLQVYQMLFLGYRKETEEESKGYLSNIDNQLLYAVVTMFGLQLKFTIRTLFGAYIRGLLDQEEYNDKLNNLYDIKKMHEEYLTKLDIPANRLDEVYEDTVYAMDILLNLAKSESPERRSEKFNIYTSHVIKEQQQ